MTAAPDALEQRLTHAYEQQLRYYDRALALLDRQARSPEADSCQWANELNGILKMVNDLDAGLEPEKAAWRQSGRHPGPRLRNLLELVGDRVKTLIGGVDCRVADLEARKARLLPDIDALIQKRRVLEAYGT
jgi:hypothetical protein